MIHTLYNCHELGASNIYIQFIKMSVEKCHIVFAFVRDNLHEIPKPVLWEKLENYFKMFAEFLCHLCSMAVGIMSVHVVGVVITLSVSVQLLLRGYMDFI